MAKAVHRNSGKIKPKIEDIGHVVYIKYLDHFEDSESKKQCTLESLGWLWEIGKDYYYVITDLCRFDGNISDFDKIGIIKRDVIEYRVVE